MDTLILKLVLVPVLIGVVSLAGRRWGPAVGGWLAGLPWTSGPVALFLAFEQGNAFAAQAAQGTLLGLVSVFAFCVVYTRIARSQGWAVSVLSGWGAFFAATLALNRVAISLIFAFAGVLVAMVATLRFLRAAGPSGTTPVPSVWEIPLRMLAATAMVLMITTAAASLGPQLSGLLTPFPVYATVLAIFTHHFEGAFAASRLLRGVVIGSLAFAVFFFVLAGTLSAWGLLNAFGLALAAALVVHGLSFRFLSAGGG